MNVLLIGTASVAIKLFDSIVTKLRENGNNNVKFMMSPKGFQFWNKFNELDNFSNFFNNGGIGFDLENKSIQNPLDQFEFELNQYFNLDKKVVHVESAQWADVIVVAPATAHTIAKMMYGICDNIVMDTLCVASGLKKRIIIAPSMNTNMWLSEQVQSNIEKLKSIGVEFVYPTVKKLACGDYGIGALADIKAIVDRVNGVKWKFPLDTYFNNRFIPTWPHPGGFGSVRRYDIHTGVDIYCENKANVFAVESGVVVDYGQFTGEKVGCGWWNDTWYITIHGNSGYITYGEIECLKFDIGQSVQVGEKIGNVIPVLKTNKIRKDIKGHSCYMLHVELLKTLGIANDWKLNTDRSKNLLDPTAYLI